MNNTKLTYFANSVFNGTDEAHFWGRQLAEHMYILFLGLVDYNNNDLKRTVNEHCNEWKKYMQETFYNKIQVTPDLVFLSSSQINSITSIDYSQLIFLITKSVNILETIIKRLKQKEWIGWIYPSLVQHMLEETLYFNRKVLGLEISKAEEAAFINEHHSGETAVTAQLIDPSPSQQNIIDIFRAYSLKRMSRIREGYGISDIDLSVNYPDVWTEDEEFILSGINPTDETNLLLIVFRYSTEITNFSSFVGPKIESGNISSIISDLILKHADREYQRFTETLSVLLK